MGDSKPITGEEIYVTVSKCVNKQNITGIQQIRRLWRIYIDSQDERIALIANGLEVRGAVAPIYDTNPYTQLKDEYLTRVLIKDIPLSVGDEVIRAEFQQLKVEVVGSILRHKLRVNGELTNCLNGDRVLHISPPSKPLPRKMTFANSFLARVYHNGQPEQTNNGTVTCSRCLQTGHHSSRCQNEVRCKRCQKPGHMQNICPEYIQPDQQRARITPEARSDNNDHPDDRVATEDAKAANVRSRQSTLADFIRPLHKAREQSSWVTLSNDGDSSTDAESTNIADTVTTSYASDGAINCSETSRRMYKNKIHARHSTSMVGSNDANGEEKDASDDDSSLSPETPPARKAGNKHAVKRKQKRFKK